MAAPPLFSTIGRRHLDDVARTVQWVISKVVVSFVAKVVLKAVLLRSDPRGRAMLRLWLTVAACGGRTRDMDMETSAAMGEDRLHTVAEVAEHMRVSNMTVYRLIKASQLPAIRVGKNYRIRATDLETYLTASLTVGDVDEAKA